MEFFGTSSHNLIAINLNFHQIEGRVFRKVIHVGNFGVQLLLLACEGAIVAKNNTWQTEILRKNYFFTFEIVELRLQFGKTHKNGLCNLFYVEDC